MRSFAGDTRRALDQVGMAFLAVAVATAPWNAVSVGPVKLAYLALIPALVALTIDAVLSRRSVRAPAWVWLLAATIGAVCVLSSVWPVDGGYVAQRYAEGFPAVPTDATALRLASLVAGGKWIVAVVGLPVAVCIAVVTRPGRVRILAVSWLTGVTASAAVAIVDQFAGTRIGGGLLPSVSFAGRQAGLSIHPNHLALSLVMAVPVAVWCAARSRGSVVLLPVAVGFVMACGLFVSGSRAGFGGAVVAVSLSMVVEPRTRRLAVAVAGVVVVAALGLIAVKPEVLASVGRRLRFVDDASAAASDTIRGGLGRQALADFQHSPVHGIGFEILSQGHDIYLQLLASGGVILVIGFVLAQLGFLLEAWTVRDGGTGLARALAIAGITFLIIGVAENQLADLFVYVPFSLVAGLRVAAGTGPTRTWALTTRRTRNTPTDPEPRLVRGTTAVGVVWSKRLHPTRVVNPA